MNAGRERAVALVTTDLHRRVGLATDDDRARALADEAWEQPLGDAGVIEVNSEVLEELTYIAGTLVALNADSGGSSRDPQEFTPDGTQAKGYRRRDFEAAWARYLSS